jgi:hypothetical protein
MLGRIDPKNLEPLTVHFENRRNHFHNLFLSLSLYIDIIPETSLEIKQNLSLQSRKVRTESLAQDLLVMKR